MYSLASNRRDLQVSSSVSDFFMKERLLLFREVPGGTVIAGGVLIVVGLMLYSLTAEEQPSVKEN